MITLAELIIDWYDGEIRDNYSIPRIIQLIIGVLITVFFILLIVFAYILAVVIVVEMWILGISTPKDDWAKLKEIWAQRNK